MPNQSGSVEVAACIAATKTLRFATNRLSTILQAPEVMRGKSTAFAADVFSFGVVSE
jgi:hypothetical protein